MPQRSASTLFVILSSAAVASLFVGCTTSYEVKVDAISKPTAEMKTANSADPVSYRIRNKNPSVDQESLRYKEAVEYVKTALSGKGMYEASDPEKAEVIVDLDYGMEAPRVKIEQASQPIYAQVGGGVRYEEVPVTTGKVISTRTVAVYEPPRTELVGYQDVMAPVTVYEKYLRMSAHENKESIEGQPAGEVWSVSVSTEDESKDLRKYLPLLASASVDYIGKDSSNQQTIKLKENDQSVGFIKKGL
jgi:hypothetical protein